MDWIFVLRIVLLVVGLVLAAFGIYAMETVDKSKYRLPVGAVLMLRGLLIIFVTLIAWETIGLP